MTEEYPENCLKGITLIDDVYGKSVNSSAMLPPSSAQSVNGWYESSINWEIDEGAVTELLERRKNDSIHFKGGVVRIPRSEIDAIIENFNAHDELRYEKKIDDEYGDNKYHGNLLFSDSLIKNKAKKNTIGGALSGAVTYRFKQEKFG